MHVPSCEPKTQADESPRAVRCFPCENRTFADACYQPDCGDVGMEDAATTFWDHCGAMPSTEEGTHIDHDGRHKDGHREMSVASDTEEDADDYEPPDVLADYVDDEVAQETFDPVINHQVKPADHSVPSGPRSLEKPRGYVTWDVRSTKCKPYDKPAADRARGWADDQAALGTSNDAQKNKRRRIEE